MWNMYLHIVLKCLIAFFFQSQVSHRPVLCLSVFGRVDRRKMRHIDPKTHLGRFLKTFTHNKPIFGKQKLIKSYKLNLVSSVYLNVTPGYKRWNFRKVQKPICRQNLRPAIPLTHYKFTKIMSIPTALKLTSELVPAQSCRRKKTRKKSPNEKMVHK